MQNSAGSSGGDDPFPDSKLPSNGDGARGSATVSLDHVMSEIGMGYFQFRLLLVCGFGFAAAAVEVVLTGFLFTELRREWALDEYELGFLPTLVGFGSIVGEFFWGGLADRHGRKGVFMITVIIVVFFGILSAFSPGYRTLYVLRFFVGFGYGGNIAVDFTIFSELLPTQGRGKMLFYMSAFWPMGQCFTVLLAWLVIPEYGWRGFLIACAIPSLLTAFLRPLIPESPRWLLLNGRDDEAVQVCCQIARSNGIENPEDVGLRANVKLTLENEVVPIMTARTISSASAGETQASDWLSFLKLFSRPLRRTTWGLLAVVAGLGFAGYATTTFMPTFLEMKGMRRLGIYQTMLLSALSQLPGVVLACTAATYVGRLRPLQVALAAIAVSLAFFAEAREPMWMVVSVCVASCFLEFGWALFHVYCPEAYPTELRATACGFVSAMGSICSMGAPFLVAWLIETQASANVVALYFASVCGVAGGAACLLLHLETKDRDLADVAMQLKAGDDSDDGQSSAAAAGAGRA